MTTVVGRVVAVYVGRDEAAAGTGLSELQVELDGVVGNRHRSFARETWSGDKQATGTIRRNERQWSAVSAEELAAISAAMDLDTGLAAADLSANLCLDGIPALSRLPKGTLLRFSSGAVLLVEEYNPPCMDLGQRLAATYKTRSGRPLLATAFSKAAKLKRGIVGVVEVPGRIRIGDSVEVDIYKSPPWLNLSTP